MKIIKQTLISVVMMFLFTNFSHAQGHDSLSYQIFFINNTNASIFMLTGNIDFDGKKLEILYLPKNINSKTIVHINIAEIIGDFENLKVLDSIEINPKPLNSNEKYKQAIVSIGNVDKGSKIVLWDEKESLGNPKYIPFNKSGLLDRANAISSEQTRLSIFGVYTSSKDLFIEVCRNQEE